MVRIGKDDTTITAGSVSKRLDPLFLVLSIVADVGAVMMALLLSLWLGLQFLHPFREPILGAEIPSLAVPGLSVLVPFWLVVFWVMRGYRADPFSYRRLLSSSVKGATAAVAGFIILAYFSGETVPRSFILLFWPASILVLALAQYVCSFLCEAIREKLSAGRRIAIVGTGDEARAIGDALKEMKMVRRGFCGYIVDGTRDGHLKDEVIGSIHDIEKVLEENAVSHLLVYRSSLSHQDLVRVSSVCEKRGVELYLIPDVLYALPVRINVSVLGAIPIIKPQRVGLVYGAHLLKRAMDVAVVVAFGIVLVPLMGLIALLIRLDSPGPIIYRQVRVGRDGKHFTFYKFRSMRTDADSLRETVGRSSGVDRRLYKVKRDPRITRVGRLIRKASLDELPQIWNVLKGDMTLVGPRPLPVADMMLVKDDPLYTYWFNQRMNVLPGITGLWQIRGRSDLPFEDLVKYDVTYILNWTLGLDLEILFKTVPVVLLGRGAY